MHEPPSSSASEAPPPPPRPNARRTMMMKVVIGACLGLGAIYAYTNCGGPKGQPQPTSDAQPDVVSKPPVPAGTAELALLSPLQVGAALGSYKVARIDAVEDGLIAVYCARGATTVELDVALASPDSPLPPAKVDPYAVYYSASKHNEPRDPSAAPNPDVVALASALARVISANLSAPKPPGIGALKTP